jgi:sialic acid synthase SpsE
MSILRTLSPCKENNIRIITDVVNEYSGCFSSNHPLGVLGNNKYDTVQEAQENHLSNIYKTPLYISKNIDSGKLFVSSNVNFLVPINNGYIAKQSFDTYNIYRYIIVNSLGELEKIIVVGKEIL